MRFILLSFVILLFSCCPKIIPVKEIEKIVIKDSIIEKLRDTTIYIEIEKIINSNVTLTTDTSRLENKFSKSTAYVVNNLLYHNLEQKSANIPFKIEYVDRHHYSVRDSIINKTQIVEVNKLTTWQKVRLTLGNILLLLLGITLIFGAVKLKKYFL